MGVVSRPLNRVTPARSDPLAGTVSEEPLLQAKYRELVRQHLDRLLDKLFTEVTGLHFHVSWAPAPAREWEARTLPTGCSACCRISGSSLLPDCGACGATQLARSLSADGDGHHFTCRLGVRNYWQALHIRGGTLGIVYLQALSRSAARHPAWKNFVRVVRHRLPPADARVMSQPRFVRAARLLQLIVRHVQTSSLADLLKEEVTSAGQAILALEKEQARLQQVNKRHLPGAPQSLHRSGRESHAEQIVRRLLGRLERDHGKTVTLQSCANNLGMNPAYLSALFSHVVGVPFKTHLTELRMAKAKALLGDPTMTVSQVAYAVGYASENRFRLAFKKITGLPPKVWRETMQTNSPLPSA